jgi:hypothetical protein
MTDQELKDLVASLAIAQIKTDAGFAEVRAALSALAKSQKETNAQLGGISKSQGDVAEEYFFNSLADTLRLGNIQFDRIERNRSIKVAAKSTTSTSQKYEYDLMLVNGKTLAVIETKYKATSEWLIQLQRNIDGARIAMPEFKDYAIYGGIAAFSINEKLIEKAHEQGYFVLQRSGDTFIADTECMRAF